jgi:hypothetical protein
MPANLRRGALPRDLPSAPRGAACPFDTAEGAAAFDTKPRVLAAQIETLTLDGVPVVLRDANGGRSKHAFDFRVSISLPFFIRFYVNFAAGREQRNPRRLADEGLTSPSRLAAFYGLVAIALLGYCLFGIFCFLYLLKSALNINVFAGQSLFHPLYALFVA